MNPCFQQASSQKHRRSQSAARLRCLATVYYCACPYFLALGSAFVSALALGSALGSGLGSALGLKSSPGPLISSLTAVVGGSTGAAGSAVGGGVTGLSSVGGMVEGGASSLGTGLAMAHGAVVTFATTIFEGDDLGGAIVD